MEPEETPPWAQSMSAQLDQLIRLMQQQTVLQRFANLGPDRILTINHLGNQFQLYLPFADQDFIQKFILNNRAFYENRMLQTLLEMGIIKDSGVIIDAGANIGNHTVFFGSFFSPCRLYCFEPQEIAFATLKKNVELNLGEIDVRLNQMLLGAEPGKGTIAGYKHGNHGGATFKPSAHGQTPMVTLDTAIDSSDMNHVSLIKIDVEGYQIQVLHGAKKILEQSHPALWIEVFPEEKQATDQLLADYGYAPKQLGRNNFIYT